MVFILYKYFRLWLIWRILLPTRKTKEPKMNEALKTRLTAIGGATSFLAGIAALLLPFAGGILAGMAIGGALFGLGLLETRKASY